MDNKQIKVSQELIKFKSVLKNKYPDVPTRYVIATGEKIVSKSILTDIFNVKCFVKKYFKRCYIDQNKNEYYYLEDFMNFVHYSVNDKDMGQLNTTGKNVMWRNPNYVVDFHKPMGWYDEIIKNKQETYCEQVLILVDIVELLLNDIKHLCKSEYELNDELNGVRFRVDYFVKLVIPLIIEINEKHHKTSLGESQIDNYKDALEYLNYKIVQIDATKWNNKYEKQKYIAIIKEHINIFSPLDVIEKILVDSEEIKDIIDDLGKDICQECMEKSEFSFNLENILKKFGINKNTEKYKYWENQFKETKKIYYDDNVNDDNYSLNDFSSDDDSDSEDDLDHNFYDNTKTVNKLAIKFIEGEHFIVKDNKILLTETVMIFIAQQCDTANGFLFVDKVIKLNKYIRTKLPDAHNNLIKTLMKIYDDRSNKSKEHGKIVGREYEKRTRLAERDLAYETEHNKILLNEIDKLKKENDKLRNKLDYF